jgi:hypothetical protein
MLKRGTANTVVILAYNLKMRKIADTTKTQVAARVASEPSRLSCFRTTGDIMGD